MRPICQARSDGVLGAGMLRPRVRGVGDAANKKGDTTSLWGLRGGVSHRSEEASPALEIGYQGAKTFRFRMFPRLSRAHEGRVPVWRTGRGANMEYH